MTKKKVLLVLNTINDYRVETYNLINEVFDFTVAYDQMDQTKSECQFKKLKLPSKKIGPFNIFGRKFWSECKKYDAVITSFDIHNFEFAFIPFIRRRYKLLTWSIGLRCSYTRPYDVTRKHEILDRLALSILNKADANIFYMDKAKEFWTRTSLDMNKVFIAPNTTSINLITPKSPKTSILFVGTLYKGKGVDKLIYAFHKIADKINDNITLDIIGKGDQQAPLKQLTHDLNLQDRVKFHGPIYNEQELAKYFEKAIICVSPTQAGLTVPKSMGYGVPVITKKDAITGGEIYHITSGVNGIIYENDEELPEVLCKNISVSSALSKMGENAMNYYKQNATPRHQAQGVIDALDFVFQQ